MTHGIDRRSFLAVTVGAAGSLLIGPASAQQLATSPASSGATVLSPFITIGSDGLVDIVSPFPDVGSGTMTALAMLVAEELEANWSRVRVQPAPIDGRAYGDQGVGGSSCVADGFDTLRRAGTLGRLLLVTAAAQRWGIPADRCEARQSVVRDTTTGATLGYGELAAAAARLPLPAHLPAAKQPDAWTLVGTRRAGVVTPSIATGAATFGIDVRLPGMLHVVVARCPVGGGRVRSVDDAAALRVPGVKRVIVLPGAREHIWMRPGVAVLAESTWAAMQGRDALRVEWDEGRGATESTAALFDRFAASEGAAPKVLAEAGRVEEALAGATARVDAVYELPFLAHLAMEPVNCTAHVTGGECRVIGAIQLPDRARRIVADVCGIPEDRIRIEVPRIGGSFGRRLLSDYAVEAVMLSSLAAAPVQVVWTREDDIRHDYFRSASRHHLRGAVDADGQVVAWDHHVAGTPNDAYPGDAETDGLLVPRTADAKGVFDNGLIPTAIPHVRLRVSTVPSTVQTGSLRAPGHNATVFVLESMIDELAHAAGADPLAFRLRFFGRTSDFPFSGPRRSHYFHPERMAGVLERAAREARWGTPLASGRARGIAGQFSHGSYVAHVIEVSVDAANGIAIHRVTAAADCGLVVNPSGVEAQVQGGVIEGLGFALFGSVPIERGRVGPSNFDGCRLLRHPEVPPIDVHLVTSGARPSGMGEPPVPAVAPALTNAIFAATGHRVRRLPIAAHGYSLRT